ncbi:MAG: hypothetical protein HY716_02450 [Planctomycetes bacterium]|nr:hypothetical protein [Planctomycetota bacterium]
MRIWDIATGRELKCLEVSSGSVYAVDFDGSGTHVLTSGEDGVFRATNIESGRSTVITEGAGYLSQFEASRDGRYVAAAVRGGIVIWNARTWNEFRRLEGHTGGSSFVSFSKDGRYLASTGTDGSVKLWETATGREAATLCESDAQQARLKFSADGRSLVVFGNRGKILVFGLRGAASARAPGR